MKNTGTSIDTLSTQADKIKTGILNRAFKKIDGIIKKTNEIDTLNEEFYIYIRKTRYPKTVSEQKRTTKKIDIFRRDIGKRVSEVIRRKGEIKEIIDTLSELIKIDDENIDASRFGQISWVDIRQQIKDKIEKAKIK